MVVQLITQDINVSNFYREVPVKKFTIVAMAFLFVFVGIQSVAQADDTKAAVEDMKGKANSKAQKAKGEAKAQMEEAQGNDMSATMERAKGKTKAAGERIKGEAKELKAKSLSANTLWRGASPQGVSMRGEQERPSGHTVAYLHAEMATSSTLHSPACR